MGMGETAELVADLSLKGNFNKEMRTAAKSTTQLERNVDRIAKRTGAVTGFVNRNLGRALDSLALRALGSVSQGLEELATLEDATTSVTGAIKQVGKGWTLTADDIAEAANRIEAETDAAFDDKAIVAASETLIRYGKVSEKNLVPALEVMTDLAARTGDVESASTLLAKALADPEKAAGKLARQGIVLTKAQQKQIKAMVKAGDVAGAQAFLLRELEKTTKGAAAASAGPYRDALNKLGDAGEDLRRGFVTGLAPAILEVTDLLTDELAKPETIQMLKTAGKEFGGALKGAIAIAKTLPWETIATSLKIAGTGAKTILDAFLGLPPWIQTAVLTGWGLNKLTGGLITDLASGLIKGVLGINAGVVNVKAATVTGVGPGGGAGAGGGRGIFGKLGQGVKILGAVSIAGASIVALAEAFGQFQQTVGEAQQGLRDKVEATNQQNFAETIANLKASTANIGKAPITENIIKTIFGSSEIQANFDQAAQRIIEAGDLTRSDLLAAKEALTGARAAVYDITGNTKAIDRALADVERRLAGGIGIDEFKKSLFTANQASISAREARAGPAHVAAAAAISAAPPKPSAAQRDAGALAAMRAQTAASKDIAAKQQATTAAVKNAQGVASREASAQRIETQNVKNTLATQTQIQTAQAVAQQAAIALQTVQAGIQWASSAVRDAVQTQAVRTGASTQAAATRGVAPPIVSTLAGGFASLRATIWAARPVIQPTTVIEKHVVSQRGGTTSDSRTRGGV